MIAAMDNFGNVDKNSLSGRMHGHNTAITWFQVQQENHIQKPPKDSLDLTNALNLNKLLFQEIYPFHFSLKLPLSDSFQVQNEFYLNQTCKDEFAKCQFIISGSQSIIRMIPLWPCKSSNRVFHSFRCYEKLDSNCSATKAICTLTFLKWRCF